MPECQNGRGVAAVVDANGQVPSGGGNQWIVHAEREPIFSVLTMCSEIQCNQLTIPGRKPVPQKDCAAVEEMPNYLQAARNTFAMLPEDRELKWVGNLSL